jgi:hypothetical protein
MFDSCNFVAGHFEAGTEKSAGVTDPSYNFRRRWVRKGFMENE